MIFCKTPYIEVTPAHAAKGEEVAAATVRQKLRRLVNLMTSCPKKPVMSRENSAGC